MLEPGWILFKVGVDLNGQVKACHFHLEDERLIRRLVDQVSMR